MTLEYQRLYFYFPLSSFAWYSTCLDDTDQSYAFAFLLRRVLRPLHDGSLMSKLKQLGQPRLRVAISLLLELQKVSQILAELDMLG